MDPIVGNAQTACHPSIFCVNDTADVSDATPGDSKCATTGNRCTLRAAIEEATALGQPRHIRLEAAVYELSKELEVKSPAVITIAGVSPVGPSSVALQRTILEPAASALPTRVLNIHPGASVTLEKLAIQRGDLSNLNGAHHNGSAVYNEGALKLQDCLVTNNMNDLGGSGTIYNAGNLALMRTSVRDNGSDHSNGFSPLKPFHGGGIYHAAGTLTIEESEVLNNKAGSGGGGINANAPVTVSRSTIAGNQAMHGGGISTTVGGDGIQVHIVNSTIAENFANSGSAISNNGSNTWVVSSTIASNQLVDVTSPSQASSIDVNSGSVTLQNSIVYDPHMKAACRSKATTGTVISANYNIFHPHVNPNPPADAQTNGQVYSCPLNATDQDVDPQIESSLKVHAPGSTAMYALRNNSPAKNRIPRKTPNGSPLMDQRGVARPQPEAIANSAFDIGAYESNVPGLIIR
jgi:hypothetical protein